MLRIGCEQDPILPILPMFLAAAALHTYDEVHVPNGYSTIASVEPEYMAIIDSIDKKGHSKPDDASISNYDRT